MRMVTLTHFLHPSLSTFITFALVMLAKSEDENQSGSSDGKSAEKSYEHGVSFHKFSGPVSGEIQQIHIPVGPAGKDTRLDYFAAPHYSYSYGVKDPATGNTQEHQETRQGDSVKGQYTVLQADGATRVVTYTADPEKGFQAIVEYH